MKGLVCCLDRPGLNATQDAVDSGRLNVLFWILTGFPANWHISFAQQEFEKQGQAGVSRF